MTPSELQSQIMSFADRFVARVSGATNDYVYLKGYATKPFLLPPSGLVILPNKGASPPFQRLDAAKVVCLEALLI